MNGWASTFRQLVRRRGFAEGGTIPSPLIGSGDRVPAILSPCSYTVRRPRETWAEADARLLEGDDL